MGRNDGSIFLKIKMCSFFIYFKFFSHLGKTMQKRLFFFGCTGVFFLFSGLLLLLLLLLLCSSLWFVVFLTTKEFFLNFSVFWVFF